MKGSSTKRDSGPGSILRWTAAVLAIGALGLLIWGGVFVWLVARDAHRLIERGAVERVIASESPVYYDDGETPLGVFFEETHRKYVPYREIPKIFVKALVAAEDARFFEHVGFDPRSIFRAMLVNLRAGKVVQGGSTLTQQTAKNIFRRTRRSYLAKFKELVQAFVLERRYTKEQILEMYANQFFVTGFGKGLGIAAAYFFDKDARDLDLVEAAFIAGSVKGPNRYNPFVKRTDAEKESALRLANARKNYVLANMLKHGFISRSQYEEAKAQPVPFRKGNITYSLNVVLDYVREQLETPYFQRILSEQGIENIATSGIKIYTSVNREIQEGALESLRKHLETLDVQLTGYDPERIASRRSEFYQLETRGKEGGLPFLARVTHVEPRTDGGRLLVSWDQGGGVIDYEGFRPLGEAWLRWKIGKWVVFGPSNAPAFLRNFKAGDLVPVRFRKNHGDTGGAELILSTLPELEGGVIVLHRGMVKAMVGGFLDRFFNRAMDAKRQLGSIFKPIVYAAALQLKWGLLDPLLNRREVHTFQNTVYAPRPDHTPHSDRVSLLWAGVKSENLATVWLLAHLTDHLSFSEFSHLTRILGLDRGEEESYADYKRRVRDQLGVVVGKWALLEAAFSKAKYDVQPDLIFSGDEAALEDLRDLHFRLPKGRLGLPREAISILRSHDFSRLRDLDREMRRAWKKILSTLREPGAPRAKHPPEKILGRFFVSRAGTEPRIVYALDASFPGGEAFAPLTWESLRSLPEPPAVSDIWIEGVLCSRVVQLLQERLRENYKRLLTLPRYAAETLYWVRDFRLLVNLRYVVYLARRLGMTSPLEPVLSFPLGPNAVSIGEAARAYHAFLDGRRYGVAENGKAAQMIPVITRITDREGEVLWEYDRSAGEEVLSPRVRGSVSEILRKVFEQGTARSAEGAVRIRLEGEERTAALPIPAFGKTGTSNRNRNSSFVGFIPGIDPRRGNLSLEEGYVIAAYVGFDDNRPMTSPHFTVYGASGALPVWVDTANVIVNRKGYTSRLDPAELIFGEGDAQEGEALGRVRVDPVSGLPLPPPQSGDTAGEAGVEVSVRGAGGNPLDLDARGVFEPCCERQP